jgi:hypothetical protein
VALRAFQYFAQSIAYVDLWLPRLIHADGVVSSKGWGEIVLDIGAEAFAIDGYPRRILR